MPARPAQRSSWTSISDPTSGRMPGHSAQSWWPSTAVPTSCPRTMKSWPSSTSAAVSSEDMPMNEPMRHLTVAQAVIAFLKNQYMERDGSENPFFAGCFGIFGHGNVSGIGQALQQMPDFRYYQSRNEQAQVHIAVGYAKMRNRLQTFACTSSIGPGATNMVTGAATATINRIPVLLLPGDLFARRNVAPVLQQLESEHSQDISVNDS